ncbi:SC5DL [Mytilus coruscus]|uniref:SC5DL n=1 Tax=Mytilus coruscus TaxID=42192 RepID=A0A6J8DXY7_MYTCO|nr:SC5DL [Mytilus coruscus]
MFSTDSNIRECINKSVFMVTVFLLATAARGEWLLMIIYLFKEQIIGPSPTKNSALENRTTEVISESAYLRLQSSVDITGAADWKCQPDKFLTPENEKHEFLLGSANMLLGATVSGFIACYIVNGGYTTLYYNISDRGWLYFLASIPAFYMYIDCLAYYFHRLTHIKWLYINIHKVHHRYHQPTAFSTVAMHPAEFLLHQSYLIIVPFYFPIHVAVYIPTILYVYYYGMMDHSGINMSALWPWQPPSIFHDNHHKYFHVNFGFNSYLFDWLHDTLRKEDRVYGEDIFGGKGQQLLSTKKSS